MRLNLAQGSVVAVLCSLLAGCGSTASNSDPDVGGAAGTTAGGAAHSGSGGASAGHASGGAASSGAAGKASGGLGPRGGAGSDLSEPEKMALFEQAPHCPGDFEFDLQGTIDGKAVEDIRTTGSNAGYINGSNGKFETPPEGSAPLEPDQVSVMLGWTRLLAHGYATTSSTGYIVPPVGFAHAGEELCVTEGALGFPDDTYADEGVFKFWIRGARVGADCSGEEVAIDVTGCMN